MFQLDTDGDGMVDFVDFQRGIAFMQRAFGLDSTAGSNHNSPKANPRAELERLSFEAESASAAGARPTRQLSQSKLLRDVARKAKKHSSSATANSPSPPVSPKPRTASSNSKAAAASSSAKKSKKRSSSASNKKLGKLGLVDRDMASAEATETESMIDDNDESESSSESSNSGDDALGPLPPSDDFTPADAMISFTKRKSSAAVFVQQLTPEQFGEIEKLFLKFDDGTGRISLANLELIVRRIDPGLPDSEVRKMIKSVDSGLSNSVGFEDFLRSMHALFKALRLKRALHRPQQTQQTTQALRETLRKRATLQRDVGRSTLPGFKVTDENGSSATAVGAAAAATTTTTTTAFTATAGGSVTAATTSAPIATSGTGGGSRNSSKSSAMPQLRNSPSSLSLMDSQETSEDITSVDEALWRHVEMLEEELHAARQEIVLLSKLAKARQRESRVLGDPAEMAAWLVLQAQRDGEAGERASAAIANAVGNDDRLFRRVARVADQRRR
jgi:hypothetical protein